MTGPDVVHRSRTAAALSAETGSGTVSALSTALAGLALCLAVLGVGQAAVVDARTSGAADLAALAAADALRLGSSPEPCALARQVADRQGTALGACVLEPGGSVRLEVTGTLPWGGSLTVPSRAGPGPPPFPEPGGGPRRLPADPPGGSG